MPELNAYESPRAMGTVASRRKWPIASVVGLLFAFVLFLPSAYFFYRAHRLTVDYPGLHDPSPNVDFYWPDIAHLINTGLAILFAGGALICTVASIWIMVVRRRRLRSEPDSW